MTGRQTLTGALAVDLGDGREIRHGQRAGHIHYTRQPRAVYACLLCHQQEGPVTGAATVQRFVDSVRTIHAARCTVAAPTTERQAA
ncbi:hypothetical protein [Streptomyces sp. NPDC001889]